MSNKFMHFNFRSTGLRIALLSLIVLSSYTLAFAVTKTSTGVGGAWISGSSWIGGVAPIAGDDVIIADGTSINVTAAVAGPINSLQVGQGTSGTLTFNNTSGTITVTGTTTVSAGAQFVTLSAAARTLGNLIVNGVFNNSTTTGYTLTGSLTVNTGATFAPGTGTYTLNGSAQTIDGTASFSFFNLAISGTYTNNSPGITVSTLLSGGGTLTQGTNSFLTLSAGGASPITLTNLNCTTNTPNTVTYGGGSPTVRGMNYNNLTIASSSGTATAGAATTVGGNLFVNSFIYSIPVGLSLTVTGTTTIASGATLTYASAIAGTFTGDFTNNGTWNNTLVAAFNFGGNLTNNNIFTASTGVYTFSGGGKTVSGTTATLAIPNIAVTGTVTTNITTLNMSGVLSGAGTLTMGTNTALNLTGTGAVASITGLNCTANTPNTVTYSGAAPSVKGTTYYNLTSVTGTATCAAAITVNNNLSVNSGTLSDGGFQIVGNGTGTLTVANGATLQLGAGGATTSTFPTLYTTANINLGTTSNVTYNSTSPSVVIATASAGVGPASYGNLLTAGTGTRTLSGPTVVANSFTNGAGTFALGGFSFSIAGAYANSGTLSGTTAGSEIIFTGSSAQNFNIGTTSPAGIYNLTINKNTGIAVTLLTTAVSVTNNLTISSGTLATSTVGLTAANTSVTGILSINGATATKALGATTINSGGAINTTVATTVTAGILNIVGGGTMTTSAAAAITTTGLSIASGGAWNWTTTLGSCAINGDLSNAGTFNNAVATTYSITGNITNDGTTFTAGGGLYTLTGASKNIVTTTGAALTFTSVTISGTGAYTVSANFTSSNPLTISGTLTIAAAGNSLVNNGVMSSVTNNVTLGSETNNGTWTTTNNTITGSITNNGTYNAATTLTGSGSGAFINAATGTLNFGGASIGVPGLTLSANGNTVVYNGASAQTVRGSTSYYNLTIAEGGPAITATLNGASTVIRNNLTVQSGIFSDNAQQLTGNATGTFTVAAGATMQYGIGGATTTNIPTNFTTANTSLAPTSTILYNTTSGITISAVPAMYGHLTLTNSGTKTAGAAHIIQGNLSVTTGTFVDAGNTITVNGNVTIAASTIHSGAGKIYLNGGSAAHTLNGTGTYNNLELDDANGANMASSLIVAGTLTLTSGTYSVGNFTLTLNGPAIAGTGTNLATTTGSTLSFGPVGNANTGLYIPSSVSNLAALIINIVSTNTVSTNSDITLNFAGLELTLTSGRLNIGANDLTLGNTAGTITGGSTTSFVIADAAAGGQLQKLFPVGSTSFTFPIGDNTGTIEYSPVALTTFAVVGGTETIGVNVTDAAHPQVHSIQAQTNYLTRYWTFSEAGTATSYSYATMTLTYLGGDGVGTLNATNDQINRYDGSWSTLNSTISATTAATSTSNTNVSGPLGGNDYTVRLNAPNTYTWNNNAGGPWTTPGNWTPARNTPANSDVLIFDGSVTPAALTVTAVPTQNIAQLQVINSADVSLQAGAAATILTFGFSASSNVLTIDASSALRMTSTNTFTLTFPALATLSTSIAGTLSLNANNTVNFTNLLTANNTITGTMINNGGTVSGAATTMGFGAGSFYNHNMNGGVIPTATWNAASTLRVTSVVATNPTGLSGTFGNVIWNNPSQSGTGTINGTMTIAGDLTVTAGTLSLNGQILNIAGDVSNSGTINTSLASSTLNMNGINPSTISGSGTWTAATTGRILNLSINNAAGVTLSPTLALQNSLTLGSGTLTASALTLGATATAFTTTRTLGSLANVPGFNFTTGVYNITYNGPSTTYTILNELPPATTPTNGSITVSLATTNVIQDKDAAITSLITSVAGATYNLNGNALSLTAATPITNNGTITANGSGSTIKFNGTAGAQTFTVANTYTGNLISNLIVDNSFSTGVIIGAQLAVGYGNVTINGSRLLNLGANGIKIAGTYTNNGTITANGGGTITLNGNSAQTFTIGTYTGSSVSNFVMNNTSGGVTLGAPLNVGTAFTLTNGILTTSTTNLLTVTATANTSVAGGSATSYVNGPLVRTLPASTSALTYSFPVGKSGYNLFELVNPTTSAAGTVILKVESQDASSGGTDGVGFSSATTPARYWQTTLSGVGAFTSSGTIRLLDATMTLTSDNVIGNAATQTGAYASLGQTNFNNPVLGNLLSASTALNTLGYFEIGSKGCLSGTYTVGATGGTDFVNLTKAVTMLNSSYVCSDVVFELTSTYNSNTEAYPISINALNSTGGTWNATFRPAAGASPVTSGAPASGINFIVLNGADNITFDGRQGGIGSTQSWIIRNRQNTGTFTPVFTFTGDASNDTLKYLQIESQNANASSGSVYIGTATTTGNDFLFIDNNSIRNRSDTAIGTPLNAIYALGTLSKVNDNITISNNNIFNFWSASASSNGINLQSNNSDFIISGNSFYQTASRTQTNIGSQTAILVAPLSTGGNFQITGNYIGGSAPGATGSAWTVAGAFANAFAGISMSASNSASSIQNNTVANINWACTGILTTQPGIFSGIYVSGNTSASIGDIAGNTIGSTTGTGSITITNGTTGATVNGIVNMASGGPINIQNNSIGSILVQGTSAAVSTNFIGIYYTAGLTTAPSKTISNNTIGSTTTANSINLSTASTSTTVQNLFGTYYNFGTSSIMYMQNNTIANLNNNYAGTGASLTMGINIPNSANPVSITGNQVYMISTTAPTTGIGVSASLIGICAATSTTGHTVSNNTVYGLTNSTGSAAVTVTGIYYGPSTNGTNNINANLIHSLAATSTASIVNGLYLNAGTATVSNNMIRLGVNYLGNSITVNEQINGIYDLATTNNIYHNSVYIGGTGVSSGSSNTYAYYGVPATGTRAIQDNIFWNARTNSGSSGKHYAIRIGAMTGLTCNYNDLLSSGQLGQTGATDYPTFGAWQGQSGTPDAASVSGNPQFVNPTGSTSTLDLHISTSIATPIEGTGIAIGAVPADYDGQNRASLTATDIGADADNFIAIDITAPSIGGLAIANTCSGPNTYIISGVTITDATGVDVSSTNKPRLYYKKSTGANSLAGWQYVQTTSSSSPYSFTIDFTALGGVNPADVIQYFVTAQDVSPAVNVAISGSSTFNAAPGSVVLGSSAFPIGGTISSFNIDPCQGTVNVGTTEVYQGLTPNGGIFQTINNLTSGLTGDLTISITSDIAVENGVNALLNTKLNGYKVRIVPSAAALRTISNVGALGVPMIPFNGATNVTIDGSSGGSGKFLKFRNTHTTATSTQPVIQYYGSASADTLKNAIIESNETTITTGAVTIGTGTNTGIVISGSTITSATAGATGNPANGIYSNTSTNTACTISGNNLENCSNAGVLLSTLNGSTWAITQNNIYQAATVTSTLLQNGISVQGGNGHTITGNKIGGSVAGATGTWTNSGAVVTNGINLVTATTGIPTVVDSNIIKNFSLSSTGANTFNGILAGAGSYAIGTTYGNFISNNTSAGTGTVSGIVSTSAATTTTLANNEVFALASTNAAATTVRGIFINGSSTSNIISKNLVYNLTGSPNAASIVNGIDMSGAGTVSNNMIRLGYDAAGASITNTSIFTGLLKAANYTVNIYHNSIYIGGSGVGTTANNTFAFRKTVTGVEDIRNNIFVNARSNSSTGGKHYAYVLNTNAALISDYNIVYAPGTGGALYSMDNGTTAMNTMQSWNFNSTFDANSGTGNPNFTAPTATIPDLHVANPSPAEGAGTASATVSDDYDGDVRSSNTPVDIGADAVNVTAVDIYRPTVTFSGLSSLAILSTGCGGGINATVTATVTDAGTGVASAALWYRRSLPSPTAWTYFTGSLTSGTANNGTWSFPVSIPGAMNLEAYQFYFVVGDGAATPNLGYAPYDATTPFHTSVTTQVTAPTSPYTVPTAFGAPLSGNVTVGSGGTYPTFNGVFGLFSAINNQGLSGPLTVTVLSNITETTTTPLNQISAPCGGGPFPVRIQPDGTTTRIITGAISGNVGLISFNGADSVTIDGQYLGDGLQHLHFKNTSTNFNGTGYNATFYWYNDATHDTIMNTIVEGLSKANASGAITGGVIMLGTGVSIGNSYNVFSNDIITGTLSGGGADASTCLLFSQGSAGAPNANNQILNNSFKDFAVYSAQMGDNFYGATNNRCYGVHVNATGNGSNWTISGNSFYTTFPENHGTFTALSFQPGASSTGNTISGNYIGGSAPQCGMGAGAFKTMGSTYSVSNTELRYVGIAVSSGDAAITGNTIKRIYITGNDYTGFVGIDVHGSTTATIKGNIIGGSISTAYNNNQNTIGTDIIQVNGGALVGGFYPGYIYGIWTTGSVPLLCDSNNFNIMLQAGAYTGGTVQCLLHQSTGNFVITNNTNSTYYQQCAGIDYNAFAIRVEPTASSSGNRIENNKLSTVKVSIADINQANSTALYVNIGPGGQACTVDGVIRNNQIHDNINVENSGYNEGIILSGNTAANGTWDISNNMIYMNNGGNANRMSLYGIDVEMNSASTTTVMYNSIWVSGSHNTNTGVANDCYALIRWPNSTDVFTAKNNILINTRAGGNGSTFFGTISNHAGPTGFTSDYNFFMNNPSASGGRNIFGYYNGAGYARFNGATPNWQFSTGQDAHSFFATYNATTTNFSTNTLNPSNLFANASIADLHIAFANGTSAYQFVDTRATVLSITKDYDGDTRDPSTPDIGADEMNTCTHIAISAQPAAQTTCSGGNVKFGVKNSGQSPYTYQWQVSTNHGGSWSPLTITSPYSTNATGDTLIITGVTSALDSNLYRVDVSNVCSDSISLSALLHISGIPVVTWESPTSHTNNVCAGSVTFFSVKGQDGTAFQWQVSPDSGATWSNVTAGAPYSISLVSDTSSLTISTVSTLNGKTYRCVVSNACGLDTSSNGSLIVQSVPVDTLPPGKLSICAGSAGTFQTGGTGITTSSWQYNNGGTWANLNNGTPAGVSYSGNNSTSLLITTSGTTTGGNYLYRCQLNSLCGTSYSDTAILNVMNGGSNAYLSTVSDSLLIETCPDGNWIYYSTISDPEKWLFAVNKNGNTFAATPVLTMHFTNPTAYDSIENASASKALYTMNRHWNVTLNTGGIDSNVGKVSVRFFYNPADTLTMMNAAKAWALAHPTSLSGYTTRAHSVEWFKTVGIPYAPANNTVSTVPTSYTFGTPSYSYGVLNGVNYVELKDITSFSGGTAAIRVAPTSGAPIALPVTMLYLTAEAIDNKYIQLNWATASEINNSGFQIERSEDGVSFSTIGWMDGHGNSNSMVAYAHDDHTVQPGIIYYYRLKQMDIDGHYAYTETVSASITRDGIIIGQLIPNPSNTATRINIHSSAEKAVTIRMYSSTGQLVRVIEQNIYAGTNNIKVNVSDLASGIYEMNIHTDDQYTSRRLVVK